MAEKKDWDLTSTDSMASAASWIRRKSGAIVVLIIRHEDVAFAVDPACTPVDAEDLIRAELPKAVESLSRRIAPKQGARGK